MCVPRETNTRPVAGFDGDVVRAAVALDIEFLDLERLGAGVARDEDAYCEKNGESDDETSGHKTSIRGPGGLPERVAILNGSDYNMSRR